jgi:type IV secretory pathway VirB2 component (pilin)
MIFGVTLQQASLSDPPPDSAIAAATDWIGNLLFGPLATTIAIIAIAWVGLAMLSGRIELRRGASVVFGCFLLFGAKGIADGFRASAFSSPPPDVVVAPPPPTFVRSSSQSQSADGYDPYAGAAVMRPDQ